MIVELKSQLLMMKLKQASLHSLAISMVTFSLTILSSAHYLQAKVMIFNTFDDG